MFDYIHARAVEFQKSQESEAAAQPKQNPNPAAKFIYIVPTSIKHIHLARSESDLEFFAQQLPPHSLDQSQHVIFILPGRYEKAPYFYQRKSNRFWYIGLGKVVLEAHVYPFSFNEADGAVVTWQGIELNGSKIVNERDAHQKFNCTHGRLQLLDCAFLNLPIIVVMVEKQGTVYVERCKFESIPIRTVYITDGASAYFNNVTFNKVAEGVVCSRGAAHVDVLNTNFSEVMTGAVYVDGNIPCATGLSQHFP